MVNSTSGYCLLTVNAGELPPSIRGARGKAVTILYLAKGTLRGSDCG